MLLNVSMFSNEQLPNLLYFVVFKTLKRQGSTNSSFIIGLEGKGVTVLHASDSISPVSHDYLKIPVENHIVPARVSNFCTDIHYPLR